MKKWILLFFVLLAAGAGAYYFLYAKKKPEVTYKTAKVERGPIAASVTATGSLAAVTTVQVGTQVSGTIQKLYVDFNSLVKKGQPIAQIDPSLFNAQVEQTRGNVLSAQANVKKAEVAVADAKRTLERNRELLQGGIISQNDFDVSQTAYDSAVMALEASKGLVVQTLGASRQAQTNLAYSTIKSPVSGTVVSRNVDVGQTVAASFQTPTLFTIAQDLTKMEIDTSVDEADISKVRVGQSATFTVDAYPDVPFRGTIGQIRSAPIVTQNVVTYMVIISVDNKDLKLKPGMTANVTIQVMSKDDVLKIPAVALRYKPKPAESGKGERPAANGEGRKGGKRGGQKVYVLSPAGVPVPVPIKTGIANDSFIEVVEGALQENQEIVVGEVSSKKASGSMVRPMGPRF